MWFLAVSASSDGGEGKGAGVEATAELKVAFSAATVVVPGEISAGESTAENEPEEKLSFFLRNSSLLLAFLLWVEGLVPVCDEKPFSILETGTRIAFF